VILVQMCRKRKPGGTILYSFFPLAGWPRSKNVIAKPIKQVLAESRREIHPLNSRHY
jgi:hypothetical protein